MTIDSHAMSVVKCGRGSVLLTRRFLLQHAVEKPSNRAHDFGFVGQEDVVVSRRKPDDPTLSDAMAELCHRGLTPGSEGRHALVCPRTVIRIKRVIGLRRAYEPGLVERQCRRSDLAVMRCLNAFEDLLGNLWRQSAP